MLTFIMDLTTCDFYYGPYHMCDFYWIMHIADSCLVCVADAPGSSLRNVGMCVFNIEAIRHPDQVLQEVLQVCYIMHFVWSEICVMI